MGLFDPILPPYDPLKWEKASLPERGRQVCEAWALQGYGTPLGVYGFYLLKLALYVGGFVAIAKATPGITSWLHPLAFQKAIVWSLLFEVLGLGCGSGPLTGRYVPPIGGFLYFLRPGTTKLSLLPRTPLLGGDTRSWFDVLLYLGIVVGAVRALIAPRLGLAELLPLALLVPVAGLADRTLFLAARAEHYWVTIVCFAFGGQWIAGAKSVQLALWLWAGISKLNHHFPAVVCVMTSNSPFTRFAWLRRRLYRDYPRDLRPSPLATWMAHAGTALELGVPLAFVLTPLGTPPLVAIVLMLLLHGFITSNVPMGVPIEWNVMVVYGAFALFWAHPEVSPFAVSSPLLAAFLVTMLVVVPLLGNLFPERISFLLSMRYYAGNWAHSIWLFRGESYQKLARLKKSSGWIYDQLALLYDRATSVGLASKVMGFRLMHLHGRALPRLIPKAVDRLDEYEWVDGEIVAGLVLGWNFGDGHLHQEALLHAVQAQCDFAPGELRCVFVESEPLFRPRLAYRIVDAHSGEIESGTLPVTELRQVQPWSS
ncbi:MAG: DUF3556 domain-containing protein [Myxococcales bacterium]|nr:DUF3556 domain-containing protein [Myxococcales bacterium]